MGNNTSQSSTSNQTVSNSILQSSRSVCNAECNQTMSGVTIISKGGKVPINISQQCSIVGTNCILKSSLDSITQSTIEASAAQMATAMTGLTFNFSNVNQKVNLNQWITNSTTQLIDSTCNFVVNQNMNDFYFYLEDNIGPINLTQSAAITNSTCNMDNTATQQTYTAAVTESDQTSKIVQGIGAGIMILLVVIIIIVVIISVVKGVGTSTGGGKEVKINIDNKGNNQQPFNPQQLRNNQQQFNSRQQFRNNQKRFNSQQPTKTPPNNSE